jgi:hypothetical protein
MLGLNDCDLINRCLIDQRPKARGLIEWRRFAIDSFDDRRFALRVNGE